METVTITKIDYTEIEEIVNRIFPQSDYSFIAQEEANNNNVYEINDITKETFAKLFSAENNDLLQYDLNKIQELFFMFAGLPNHATFCSRLLLEYLCWLELLPKGDYLISVSW